MSFQTSSNEETSSTYKVISKRLEEKENKKGDNYYFESWHLKSYSINAQIKRRLTLR